MKTNTIVLTFLLFTYITGFGQPGNSFKYQAVVRDGQGLVIANQLVSFRISILSDSETGSTVYCETHSISTSAQGLVNLNIGKGTLVSGSFTGTDWGNHQFYIKIEIDPQGGSNYTEMGVSPLLSVPFAIHAQTVTQNDDADADPTNEIQDLQLNGGTLTITNNPSATPIDLSPYIGTNTDEQTLSIVGDSLAISNGNKVDLSSYKDNTDAQQLTLSGTQLTIDGGNTVDLAVIQDGVNDADTSVTNEIQDLQLNGSTLTITKNASATPINLAPFIGANTDEQTLSMVGDSLAISNGNKVDLSPYKDNTDAQLLSLTGTELTIDGGNTVDLAVIQDGVNDADADPTNEIQDLQLTDNTLKITNNASATSIDLSLYKDNTDAQQLTLTGTNLTIGGGNTVDLSTIQDGVNDADADPTNELQSLSINKDTLYLSNSNHVTLPKQDMIWDTTGSNIYFNDGKVGIGTSTINSSALLDINSNSKGVLVPRMTTVQRNAITSPVNGLLVYDTNYSNFFYYNGTKSKWTLIPSMPTATSDLTEALFAVLNQNGDTVFAVYPEGVRINVADGKAKGNKGGFAVASIGAGTKATTELFRLTNDSVRFYLDTTSSKGNKGGFAVASIGAGTKSLGNEYLRISNDSIRMYVEESKSKGNKGGFAVASIGAGTKANSSNEILRLTNDSVRIYIDESATKGNKGGFAVASIGAGTKDGGSNFMYMKPDNYFIGHEAGKANITGLYNSFIGYQVGKANTSGKFNSFMGYKTGISNSDGESNVFIGNESGYSNQTGDNNTFMGYRAGYTNKVSFNSFIGFQAGFSNDTGQYNSFMGYNAGYSNTKGSSNVFIGNESGRTNSEGNHNVFLGFNSGYTNATGNNNTFLGHVAGFTNSIGSNNVFLGDSSGYSNTSGEQNIFLGNGSGKTNSQGNYNAFIGYEAGQSNTTANNNAFIGYQAGRSTKVGSKNVFIGYQAGYKNVGTVAGPSQAGNNNIYIGDQAAYNNSLGRSNVYIGHNAGLGSNPINTASAPRFNVYIGYQAGYLEYQGRNNTFIGYQSGYSNYSGTFSTFIGDMAGYTNYNGSYNTFIGNQAGFSHYSGNSNVNIGNYAGWSNSTGDGNVFLGYYAGYYETGSNKLFIDNQNRSNETLSRTNALIYGEFNGSVSSQQLTFNSKVTTNGTFNYGADAGTTDDYTVTITGISSYITGMVIYFKANTANTGACTINVNSLGAKSLKMKHDLDPSDNYFESGSMVQAIYDGTNFQILNPSAN